MPKACQFSKLTLTCTVALLALGLELANGAWHSLASFEAAQELGDGMHRYYVFLQGRTNLEPIRVVKIEENEESIVPGEDGIPMWAGKPFEAGDDWIRNLSFVLENETSRKIDFITLAIAFREDQAFDKKIRVGKVPDLAAATYFHWFPGQLVPKGTGKLLGLNPGSELPISLNGLADEIEASRGSKLPFSRLRECSILVTEAAFDGDDGLIWDWGGLGYRLPDPETPKGWKVLARDYFPGTPPGPVHLLPTHRPN